MAEAGLSVNNTQFDARFLKIFLNIILILFLKKMYSNKKNLLTSMPPTYQHVVLGKINQEKGGKKK